MIIDRKLLGESGRIQVDYLDGPFRRGFHVNAVSQAGCSTSSSGCSGCG